MRKNPRMLQAGWLVLSIGFWATGCQRTAIDDSASPFDVTATAKPDHLSVHKINN
jgi:hypothetical protein